MAKKYTYTLTPGYVLLPERRKLKPEGKYTLPIGNLEINHKYTLWDFVTDITQDLLDRLHFGR